MPQLPLPFMPRPLRSDSSRSAESRSPQGDRERRAMHARGRLPCLLLALQGARLALLRAALPDVSQVASGGHAHGDLAVVDPERRHVLAELLGEDELVAL